MWAGPSATEMVVDYIEEHGPQTMPALQAAFPQFQPKRIKSGITRAVSLGRMHNVGATSRKSGVYVLGPKPGWLPNPLPPTSVWEYASGKFAGYEIPKL